MFRVASDGICDTVEWVGNEFNDEGLFAVEGGIASFVCQMNRNQFHLLKNVIEKSFEEKSLVEIDSPGKIVEKDLRFMIVPHKSGGMINILSGPTRMKFFVHGDEVSDLLRLM